MKSITWGSRDKIVVANKDVEGVNLSLNINHVSDDTDFVSSDVDSGKITLTVTLVRAGKEFRLMHGNVKDLVSFTNFRNNLFLGARDVTQVLRTTLEKGESTKTTAIVPFYISLGGMINLRGSDRLEIEVDAQLASINQSNVNSTTSKIVFSEKVGVGLEVGTPYVRTKVIEANQADPTYALGDNVTKILLLNYDLSNYLVATRPVSQIGLGSDKLNWKKTIEELLSDQFQQLPDADASPIRYQNFELYNGTELDNVKLDLSLIEANVASSKNVIVWQEFFVDARLVALAQSRQAVHEMRDAAKLS